MKAPLEGIRVVDISGSFAGPYCSMLLGDLGADVVKVERPGGGDECRTWGPPFVKGESAWFLSVNRNKRSIALSLKEKRGVEVLKRLVAKSDVFIENLRPSALDRSGFAWKDLEAVNPRLVYCALTGFGLTGPRRDAPAYDLIAEGFGGIMSVSTPEGERPLKVGTAVADIVAAMLASSAIASALFARERTGVGGLLDCSLLDGQVAFMAPRLVSAWAGGEPQRCLGGSESPIAIYRSFRARDGWLNLGVGNDEIWGRFCRTLALDDLLADPELGSNKARKGHQERIFRRIEEVLPSRTVAEWVEILSKAGVPVGPVQDCGQVGEDPQVLARGLKQEIEHPVAGKVPVTAPPWVFSGERPAIRRPPPRLGEHTREVLSEAGCSEGEIADLLRSGIVAA